MIIEQRVTIAAPVERVWDFMMDVPSVSRCVPGVESVVPAGEDGYRGTLQVKVGPIVVRLEGRLRLAERDRDALRARMDVDATDRRLGGAVTAKMTMLLLPLADGRTDLEVRTDAAVLGKLGQFGQAVIKRQADQIMGEFARNVSAALESAPRRGAP